LYLHVLDALDDAEQGEGAARERVEHAEKLASVGPPARRLLAVDVPVAALGSAQRSYCCRVEGVALSQIAWLNYRHEQSNKNSMQRRSGSAAPRPAGHDAGKTRRDEQGK
jgi:hypothetical protein